MTMREIEDYYRNLGDSYYQKAQNLRQMGDTATKNKDFNAASTMYLLSSQNSECAQICWRVVADLAKHEILESTK